jgi:putative tryptophan/tyrosine transport system substrate-binding protein
MRRRDFIAGLGGAVAWPLAVRAQAARMRRIGVLVTGPVDDPESLLQGTAFVQGLQELRWIVGRNVRLDYRWGIFEPDRVRKDAVEPVALAPDVMLVMTGVAAAVLQQVTRTIPIVFVLTIDPVGAGLVANLGHPGRNATGFAGMEFNLAAKWLQLLKEISPRVRRVAVLRDPTVPAGSAPYGAIQGAASSFGVEVVPIDTRDRLEFEQAIAAFAQKPDGGLILAAPAFAQGQYTDLTALAARHHLPAVWPSHRFVAAGGLISYSPDTNDQFWRAAGYVDRILRGEMPADLPVQQPTKFDLAINLKTAKALGLSIPSQVLAIADEVIE